MKRPEKKKNESHHADLGLRRAPKALSQQAAEHWQYTAEELDGLYRQSGAVQLDTRRIWRRTRLRTAAVVVIVALLLGLMTSLGISQVRPAPDGYTMNREADRAGSIVIIDSIIYKA